MVTHGWLKASHRALDEALSTPLRLYHPHAHPEAVRPGEIARYEIEIWPTSYPFRKGNRIRVEIGNGDSMISDGLFHHYYGHKPAPTASTATPSTARTCSCPSSPRNRAWTTPPEPDRSDTTPRSNR